MATEDERADGFGGGQDAASVRLEAKIDALLSRRWTDERLDDLAKRVDDGFKEVRGDITRLDARVDAGFKEVRESLARQDAKFDERFARQDAKFDERFARHEAKFDERFARQDAKFDRLQAQMLQGAIGIVVAVVAAMIGAAKLGLLGS